MPKAQPKPPHLLLEISPDLSSHVKDVSLFDIASGHRLHLAPSKLQELTDDFGSVPVRPETKGCSAHKDFDKLLGKVVAKETEAVLKHLMGLQVGLLWIHVSLFYLLVIV